MLHYRVIYVLSYCQMGCCLPSWRIRYTLLESCPSVRIVSESSVCARAFMCV